MDAPIRSITIAEHADIAARCTAETGEIQPNPHEKGTAENAAWKAAYERNLLKHTAPECEGSA
jgi:hypothetical protein